MIQKKYTQIGTFSILVMVPFFILSLLMIVLFGLKEPILLLTLGFVALTLLTCLLIFYKLTIIIDDTYVTFKLGIGIIQGKYNVAEIESCKSVRNDPLSGVGIRIIRDGWLYNVTGFGAIELTFKNGGRKVRIGTDKADEITELLNGLLTKNNFVSEIVKTEYTGFHLTVAVIILAIVVPFFMLFSGRREAKVLTTESDMTIKGVYGMTIRYADIVHLDTVSTLPHIRLRTNGYAFAKTYKGNFRLEDKVNARLFVKSGNPPFIFIKTDDLNIYLNFADQNKTSELFRTISVNSDQVQ